MGAALAQVSTSACSNTLWYPQLTGNAAAQPPTSHSAGPQILCALSWQRVQQSFRQVA